MYPRLGPPQRGQTKPPGQRCRLNCSPHCCSSPNDARNSCTVSIWPRFPLTRFCMKQDYRYSFACASLIFILVKIANRAVSEGVHWEKRWSKSRTMAPVGIFVHQFLEERETLGMCCKPSDPAGD